ncbi:MAG TPA: hypothetical protein VNG91_04675, partial [Terriglobia bacterium]|nr:hypothetical protein [Terriglobia bacterium]
PPLSAVKKRIAQQTLRLCFFRSAACRPNGGDCYCLAARGFGAGNSDVLSGILFQLGHILIFDHGNFAATANEYVLGPVLDARESTFLRIVSHLVMGPAIGIADITIIDVLFRALLSRSLGKGWHRYDKRQRKSENERNQLLHLGTLLMFQIYRPSITEQGTNAKIINHL